MAGRRARCPSTTAARSTRSSALSAAAAVTERRCKVGTGICLVAQHDPIVLAKEVASLDYLSGGRFLFGIGVGWNADEMEHHGVDPSQRRDVVREKILAMRGLWTEEEAGLSRASSSTFSPSWSWPKPVAAALPADHHGRRRRPGHVPPRRRVLRRVDADPRPQGHPAEARPAARRSAEEAGRDPATISLGVFGCPAKPEILDDYAANGFTRLVLGLPQDGADEVLATLDRYAPLVERYA